MGKYIKPNWINNRTSLERTVEKLLTEKLPGHTFQKVKPKWLVLYKRKLELDFYSEPLHLAIEVQGRPHYRYSNVAMRDAFKRRALKIKNIYLIGIKGGKWVGRNKWQSATIKELTSQLDHELKLYYEWFKIFQESNQTNFEDKKTEDQA